MAPSQASRRTIEDANFVCPFGKEEAQGEP
jgi:hypothetical protein